MPANNYSTSTTRCSRHVVSLLAALCLLPNTVLALSFDAEIQTRPAPERDQISYQATLTDGDLDGMTSRLSGHFESAGQPGVHVVSARYLLGDNDTRALARSRLAERLKTQALEKAGVYRAFEERLSSTQQLDAATIQISGAVVELHDIREQAHSVDGGRIEIVMEAQARVDNESLKDHLDALYDNHALSAANARLQQENSRLRQQPSTPSVALAPTPGRPRTAVPHKSLAPDPKKTARMDNPYPVYAGDETPWLLDTNLFHSDGWEHAYGAPYEYLERYGRSFPSYQPEGVKAIPQSVESKAKLAQSMVLDVLKTNRAYRDNLEVEVLSSSRHDGETVYMVNVSGFKGYQEALLERTGLPFEYGQMTPEAIADLDPWSSLRYWLLADTLADTPIMLTLEANSDTVPGRQPEALASIHQPMLTLARFSHDRTKASVLAFSPFEKLMWHLGGQHLPHVGVLAPASAFVVDGQRHDKVSNPTVRKRSPGHFWDNWNDRARRGFDITQFTPSNGTLTFRYVAKDGDPLPAGFSATISLVEATDAFPVRHGDSRDEKQVRGRLTKMEARQERMDRL